MNVLVLDFDNCIALDEKTGKGSEEVKDEAWFQVFPEYDKEILEKAFEEAKSRLSVSTGQSDRKDIVLEVCRYLDMPKEQIEGEVASRCDAFNRVVQEGIVKIGLPEQVRVKLEELSLVMSIYVNTATLRDAVVESLDSLGLTPLFKGVYGRPGTKLENLKTIIQAESAVPEDVLFVDDQPSGWEIASEVNCKFIGIHTERNKLWHSIPQPFPIIRSLSELSGVFDFVTRT